MITLTDLYCLYNRARGTDLISPEDLLEATRLMPQLQLGLSSRLFQSGTRVIQSDTFDEHSLCEKLYKIFEDDQSARVTGLSIIATARHLNTSLIIAKEQLLFAESLGNLCRDETLAGTYFYPNLFDTYLH
jgi:ESCRT-II complex subunit VPS36